jgi:hypothetical protein
MYPTFGAVYSAAENFFSLFLALETFSPSGSMKANSNLRSKRGSVEIYSHSISQQNNGAYIGRKRAQKCMTNMGNMCDILQAESSLAQNKC